MAGCIADAHHLIQGNVTPLLPQLLTELAGEVPEEEVHSILSGYGSIYQSLEVERLEVMPELLLEFAHSLKALPDKSWAKSQVYNSVKSWLKLRGVIFSEEANLIEAMQPLLMSSEDLSYVENVGECLTAIGDESALSQVKGLLSAIAIMETAENHYQSALALAKQGDYQGAIAAVDQAIRLNPNESKFQDFRQQLPKSAGSYQFDVITVNSRGEEIKREQGKAQYLSEDLDKGVTLDLVAIPGGTFMMGSPEVEGRDDERPQHQVTVQPFFMGKFQVTQAQWKAIAFLPKVERDLKPEPSKFTGDNRPVERVSWYDAVEFCQRLSLATRREYRLPSEAEWEYACRARTSTPPTPFHFGKTISTDLANYKGNYNYAEGPKGVYRKETTAVGQFPPNAFGLYDMHGNVWEWCADTWHGNYENAPTDGSVWITEESNTFVRRGGSWVLIPVLCRSAIRIGNYWRSDDVNNVGFRVVWGLEEDS